MNNMKCIKGIENKHPEDPAELLVGLDVVSTFFFNYRMTHLRLIVIH